MADPTSGGDWDVAGGSDKLVLGKLSFAAELDGLISAGVIMASKAAAWLLRVDLDVILVAKGFPAKRQRPASYPGLFALSE